MKVSEHPTFGRALLVGRFGRERNASRPNDVRRCVIAFGDGATAVSPWLVNLAIVGRVGSSAPQSTFCCQKRELMAVDDARRGAAWGGAAGGVGVVHAAVSAGGLSKSAAKVALVMSDAAGDDACHEV